MNRRSVAQNKTHALSRRSTSVPASFGGVRLTHAERMVFPDGKRKSDVAHYYAAVMPQLLAAIAERPLSIVRCPDGINATCFFQKHLTPGFHRVQSVQLREVHGGSANYISVGGADEVFELVQFNALEFHPWATRVGDTEHTDYLIFDLDPGPGVNWPRVTAAAQLLRERCAAEGLTSFVRTSGGKGLHVVVPLRPAAPWNVAKAFAEAFAQSIVESNPREFIATASTRRRADRIYIDWLRNVRGATSIASYSLRARPGAPVATPLRWDELWQLKGADAFTMRNVPMRLHHLHTDPWQEFASVRQTIA
jgi:bifunctional non-homologous end joining protein LigD